MYKRQVCADGREFAADAVLLATGHSARDVYRMMLAEGLALEQKPFAVGQTFEKADPIFTEVFAGGEG